MTSTQEATLEELLKAGDYRVYHLVRRTSRTGATQFISLFTKPHGGAMLNISREVGALLDTPLEYDPDALCVESRTHLDFAGTHLVYESAGKHLVYCIGNKLKLCLRQQRI